MNILSSLTSLIGTYTIPLILLIISSVAIWKGTAGFDAFIEGAKNGLKICIGLTPTLIGLLMAIATLRTSGFLDVMANRLEPIAVFLHFPKELIPLAIIKVFSSSAATSLLLDIYKEFGTDSYIGFLGSIMLSSTETIMYLMTVYFAASKTRYSRYILPGALLVYLTGIAICILLT